VFAHTTLHKITTDTVSDHPFDPFNRKVELYQTWQLAALESLEPGNESSKWARQGFSTRGAPDGAPSFGAGDSRYVVDPQIALGLPKLSKGERRAYRFDVHYWESDKSSEKVRAVFSDTTLSYMARAWEVARADEAKALDLLTGWFDENWEGILTGLVGAASPAALGVITKYNVLPLLDALFKYVKNNGDDYHQMHRYVVEYQGKSDGLKWQVTSPSRGPSGWMDSPSKHQVVENVSDAANSNQYRAEWVFRVVD